MRAYLGLVKIALQSRSAYRTEVFLHLFNQIVALFAQVAVWRALLGGTEGVTSSMGTVTLHEMVTYVVVSRGISVLVLLFAAHSPLRRMDDMIRSGQIAIELIKPLDLEASLFCEAVGANLFEVFFVLLPLAGIGVIVFEMDLPSWQNLPFFIITLING
jgi:ABC-2 type transport system permease protein